VRDFLESLWQCGGQGFEPPQLHSTNRQVRTRVLACRFRFALA
jgi:hypothetical protein